MCTAITLRAGDFYFGRTLDYHCAFGEELTLTPRRFPLKFRHMGTLDRHHAILGMALTMEDYPLYFDAVNEKGLAMAGLRFAHSAWYGGALAGKDNVAQFELIGWVLAQCDSVGHAKQLLRRCNVTDTPFREDIPAAPLHWILADGQQTLTLEVTRQGLQLYDNPVGVLTNEPPFPYQMWNLANYGNLTPREPENRILPEIALPAYTHGLGTFGLPGDGSSGSRFVRAAFYLHHSTAREPEPAQVERVLHILDGVSQIPGCCQTGEPEAYFTRYSICCNATRGTYYYTTWENRAIRAVCMERAELTGSALRQWSVQQTGGVQWQN